MDIFGLDTRQSDIFDLTCTYLIHCPNAQKNCLPLPDCPPIGWGFGGEAKNAGLEAKSHDGAIIITKDGKVEIKLGAHKDIRLHQLLKNTIVDEQRSASTQLSGKKMESSLLICDYHKGVNTH